MPLVEGAFGVGREKRRRPGAQRAVHESLQGAGLEPRVGRSTFAAHGFELLERGGEREPFRDARRELPFLLQFAINEEILPRGIVLHGGDAVPRDVGQRQLNSLPSLLGGWRRNFAFDQPHGGGFLEHAGRFVFRVALDFAARGIFRLPGNSGELKRQRIRHGDVTGDMRQQYGILRGDGIQIPPRRKFLFRPERVIPSAAGDPLALFVLRDGPGKAFLQLRNGGRSVQADGQPILAGAAEMHVCIVEAGHHEAPLQIHGARAFVRQCGDLRVIANRENLLAAHEHGFSPGLARIVGVDARVAVQRERP
jgi:hypothetical protein